MRTRPGLRAVLSASLAAFVLAAGQVQAMNLITVTRKSNSGVGSLRWAIKQANSLPGGDRIVFDPSLKGSKILPKSPLPTISDDQTIIQGDVDGDRRPDIVLDGTLAGTTSGLTIAADFCHVEALCVVRFQRHGIQFRGASGGGVYNSHLGVTLSGVKIARSGGDQIRLWASDHVTIGRATPPGRNTIAAGSAKPFRAGIAITNSSSNTVANNNIGIAANGKTPLTTPANSGAGVIISTRTLLIIRAASEQPSLLSASANNSIGTNLGQRNVFGGMRTGVLVSHANANTIRGNYFGLTRDGGTHVPIRDYCVRVSSGSRSNGIGGSSSASRNVISGGKYGVGFEGAGTADNAVTGNDFGLNGDGTAELPLVYGVFCRDGAGAQNIVRNTFGSMHPKMWTIGVFLDRAGAGSYVSRNAFGVPPALKPVTRHYIGVVLFDSQAAVRENVFRRSETGIYCYDNPLTCRIMGNRFRACDAAVKLEDGADVNLGNLGNGNSSDDGGNEFYASNDWYIRNESASYVKAEGNHFPTSNPLLVGFKIWDKLDDSTRGRVDISPMGDVLADANAESPLAITSASAAPTPSGGAEITFTLSSAAQVQARILNIAGRPVRTLCRAKDCEAGANTLLWNAESDQGLPAPNGTYLVEVTAKADDGSQARALAQVTVRR